MATSGEFYAPVKGRLAASDDMAELGSAAQPFNAANIKTLAVTGNQTVAGTLAVTGAANFAGATTVTSSLRVDGGLTVTGAVSGTTGQLGQLIYSSFKAGGTPWFQPDGTNTKDIMDSFTLAAGVLTTGRTLKFTVYGVHTGNNTNVCTAAITVGGTLGAYQTTLATGTDIASFNAIIATTPFRLEANMYQLEASVQRCYARFNGGATAEVLPTDTSLTQDMTTSKTFILTLKNVTTVTDASIYGWTVELL